GFTSNDAELILRGAQDNRISVVDTARGQLVRDFPTMAVDKSYGWCLSPDGATGLIRAAAPEIRVGDGRTGKELPSLTGHKIWARAIAFTADGKTLLTGGGDDYVLVRDWPSGKVRKRIDLGRGGVEAMIVTEDGRTLTVLFGWEKALHR